MSRDIKYIGMEVHKEAVVQISSSGTIHIQLRHAQVRVEGSADPVVLRVLMECLQR